MHLLVKNINKEPGTVASDVYHMCICMNEIIRVSAGSQSVVHTHVVYAPIPVNL